MLINHYIYTVFAVSYDLWGICILQMRFPCEALWNIYILQYTFSLSLWMWSRRVLYINPYSSWKTKNVNSRKCFLDSCLNWKTCFPPRRWLFNEDTLVHWIKTEHLSIHKYNLFFKWELGILNYYFPDDLFDAPGLRVKHENWK